MLRYHSQQFNSRVVPIIFGRRKKRRVSGHRITTDTALKSLSLSPAVMSSFSALVVWCLITLSSSYVIKDDTNLTPGAKEVFNRLGVGRGELSMQVSEGARKMGESPIYYIKLPPSNYYFSPKKSSNKPIKKVPIAFHNNGKPHHVYHWTQPVSSKRPIYIKRTSPHKQVYPDSQTIRIKTSTPKQQPTYVKPSVPFRQAQSVDERYSVVTQPKPAKLISAQSEQHAAYVKPQESLTLIQSHAKDLNTKKNSNNMTSISVPKITIKSQEGNLNKPVTAHSELESGTEAPQPIIIQSSPTFSNAEVSPQQSHPSVDRPKPLVIKPSVSFIKPEPIPVKGSNVSYIKQQPIPVKASKPIPVKASKTETQQRPILRIGKTPTRKSSTQSTANFTRKNYRHLAKDFKYNGRPDTVYIWRPDQVIHIRKSADQSG